MIYLADYTVCEAIKMSEITILDGMENMDFERVSKMLARSYWVPGIKKEEVVKGAENSALVVGAFSDGRQIGYTRAISDKTRFAYISDVFVDEEFRGRGIAQKMIRHILAHPSMSDVYQWLLRTTDAHGLYKKLGFDHLSYPDRFMEIRRERPNP